MGKRIKSVIRRFFIHSSFLFSGIITDSKIQINRIERIKIKEIFVSIEMEKTISSNIFIPIKASNADMPVFKKRNIFTMLLNKKNKDRKPIIAKILEKKTI